MCNTRVKMVFPKGQIFLSIRDSKMEGSATKLLYPATLKVVFAPLQTLSPLVRLKVLLHETIRNDDF